MIKIPVLILIDIAFYLYCCVGVCGCVSAGQRPSLFVVEEEGKRREISDPDVVGEGILVFDVYAAIKFGEGYKLSLLQGC